jgi:uncharacterized membrane protein YgcG
VRLAFRVALAAASLAFIAAPATARAMGAVVSSPPGASSAIAVRVAVAASDEPGAPTAKWGSVTVQGSATAFVWIVPARPGALLQLSPDAWLEALEEATAPRVVPPDATPPCDFPGGAEVEGSFTPTATTAPGAVTVATDRATLDAALASWGLSVTPELSPAIDAVLASGSDLVAMLFTDTRGTIVTRTFRVIDDAPVAVPLSLTTAGANEVQVTAFALRSASPAFGAEPDLTIDPTAVLWRSDGTSSYASARDTMLDANPGRWLLETSGPTIVSTSTTLPDGSTVPSLTAAYESLVATAGDAGTSDDLAVALGAGDAGDAGTGTGSPGETWLARGRTVIPAGSLGENAPITDGSPDTIGPVLTASGYAQTCEASAPPATQQQGGTSGGGGSGGTSSNQGASSGAAAVDLGAGAAQAAADSTDGCGGDSTDSSGDDCGGDTSTSGSDSNSSDSSDGCSGSSTDSSGDSSGGCSGSSDSSSSSDCSVESGNGRRTHKSGTSRFLVFAVGIAALWRRRARGR